MADRVGYALTALAIALLGALAGLGGIGFLAAALYQLLLHVVPPSAAAAIVGAVSLVVMLFLLWLSRLVLQPVTRPPARRSEQAGEQDPVAAITDALRPLLRGRGREATAFAFGAGIILGISPRARRAAWRGLARLLNGSR